MRRFYFQWGTRGFKAPEVELLVDWRNGGVDIWAVGVVLMAILFRRTAVFRPQKRVHILGGSNILSQTSYSFFVSLNFSELFNFFGFAM